MFELTEIEVKLRFLRNTKEASFSLFKTLIVSATLPGVEALRFLWLFSLVKSLIFLV